MPMRRGMPMPSLEGATEWLNGQPDMTSGVPTLVYFWSISCHICHENMPRIASWRQSYGPRGLRFVSIHMPRNPQELDVERVSTAAAEMGITDPLGIDNKHAVTDAFENQYVPAYFLFDANGMLAGRTAGDAGLALLENSLKRLFPDDVQS